MSLPSEPSSEQGSIGGTSDNRAGNDSSTLTAVSRCGPRAHLTRKSAGRRELFPGYLNTENAVVDSDASESDGEKRPGRNAKGRKAKRLRLYQSPTPPRLSPALPATIEEERCSPTLLEALPGSTTIPEEINLTFNIPPGHRGPIVVKLALDSLLTAAKEKHHTTSLKNAGASIRSHQLTDTSVAELDEKSCISVDTNRKGFLDLPVEIRQRVYVHTFVYGTEGRGHNDHVFDMLRPVTMRRSSQFLATCRTVHNEGTKFLYGEIEFRLSRFKQLRGNFWDSEWEAVGWKDVRRFLTTIGRVNLGLIRNMVITFQDGEKPRHNYDIEATRFINDGHLIFCLKLLAKNAQLRQLRCIFRPKKAVTFQDARFLDHLSEIRVDTLCLEEETPYPFSHWPERWIHSRAREYLKNEMVRYEKLYPERRCARTD